MHFTKVDFDAKSVNVQLSDMFSLMIMVIIMEYSSMVIMSGSSFIQALKFYDLLSFYAMVPPWPLFITRNKSSIISHKKKDSRHAR